MKHIFTLILITTFFNYTGLAQDSDAGAKPVIIEAESGTVGSNYSVLTDGDVSYVTTDVNYTGSSYPGGSESVIIYQVDFQSAGTYQLFVRMRVGANEFEDDSYFSASGFGEKSLTDAADWVMINGLADGGFTGDKNVVYDAGGAGSEIWKWVNITNNFYGNFPDAFVVEEGNLSLTFQIGSREDGLEFDKIAFGKADLFYTVEALDNELAGSVDWPEDPVYPGPPLAEGKPKFLGNVKASGDYSFVNIWNQLTPGNEGKWASIANNIDTTTWDWSALDELYAYAKENDILFKEHTLIWGSQQPYWISGLDQAKQLEYIEYWIRKCAERYPETDIVDVVNEPLASHNPPDGENGRANYKEALGGDGETGWDWVIKAFEMARKYYPNAELLLNDYGIINSTSATNTYIEIIKLLNDRGLIDGIGVQGHRFALESTPNSMLNFNINRLAAIGLPIYITELDLGNIDNEGTPDDDEQLELYQRIFPLLWEHPAIQGITLWGYYENDMWQETCYLVRSDGTLRPAFTWLAEYVQETVLTTATEDILYRDAVRIKSFPNPFSSSTKIQFDLKRSEHVSIKILDAAGREVTALVDENLDAGTHIVTWNAANNTGNKLNRGVYICRFVAGDRIETMKLLLID
ncbi:endo-1,4-beta-xylanase [uncultured Draconibacterium sp.]|uniref:endo-1,4-beta-xylanase n=1 Tax=uncultured Draconibacterium sp. TaxID=1573823 RepID=UPI0025DA95BB|nr:endo-1,4-beta-xylanase [uncultured Draconibacterium sp.]